MSRPDEARTGALSLDSGRRRKPRGCVTSVGRVDRRESLSCRAEGSEVETSGRGRAVCRDLGEISPLRADWAGPPVETTGFHGIIHQSTTYKRDMHPQATQEKSPVEVR